MNDKDINFVKFSIKLKADKDFENSLDASNISGVPLTFVGDRIVDFQVNGLSEYNNLSIPDKIIINPSAYYFDLEIGDKIFENIPFDRQRLTENTFLFKSSDYAKIDVNIKIRLTNNYQQSTLNLSISSKSNNIKDILNFELFKKEGSNHKFKLKLNGVDEYIYNDNIPIDDFDENYLMFLKKVNYINDKLNLNLSLDEEYIINKSDVDAIENICEFINNKRIMINHVKFSLKMHKNDLKELIDGEKRNILIKNDYYNINLLGNTIDLGSCQIQINNHKLLNFEEVRKIYEDNKHKEEFIKVPIILKDYDTDELYIDFNV